MYKFGDKELQSEFRVKMYDFGTRIYNRESVWCFFFREGYNAIAL